MARRARAAVRVVPSVEALPDVLQFMRLVWALVHAVERTSKRMSGELGVTGPQRLVVRVIGLFPHLSAGELAAILHVHPSTLTGVLQRLVARRLVQRVSDPQDRRRSILRLTALGRRLNATTGGTVEWAVARALNDVALRDRSATSRVLTSLTHHLLLASKSARSD